MRNISIKKIAICMCVIVVIALAGYYILFSMIKKTNEQTSLLALEAGQFTDRENTLRSADKLVESLEEDIARVDSYFLSKTDAVSFIETVEGVGQKSGVEVTISSVGVLGTNPEQKPAPKSTSTPQSTVVPLVPETLSLRADVRGSWSSIMQFISYLEHIPYKISISRASMSRISTVKPFFGPPNASGAEEATPLWTASFEIGVLTL